MHGNQPLVSIIMPVFNCEMFLSESIQSVISQSYQNWELIIVDDGSQDASVPIIESYVEKDPRVRLYKNETGEHGPGIARNFGIERISGKYTYFLDADDWIEKDLLRDTVALAEETNADLVPFGFLIEDNEREVRRPLMPSGNLDFRDFQSHANEIIRGTWSECHELIRSELLHNVRHNSYRKGEDICFQMDLLCNVKKVCGIDKAYYHYRVVPGSITHNKKWYDAYMESNVAVWEKERKFLNACGVKEHSQVMKNAAIERYTWCIYCLCEKNCSLPLTEKYRQIEFAAHKMEIKKYKRKLAWMNYPGIGKLVRLLIKLHLEKLLVLLGTLYFAIADKGVD